MYLFYVANIKKKYFVDIIKLTDFYFIFLIFSNDSKSPQVSNENCKFSVFDSILLNFIVNFLKINFSKEKQFIFGTKHLGQWFIFNYQGY